MSFTEHLMGLAELEDNIGKRVAFQTSAETIERLERERNELAAQVERLRGAYNSAKTWEDLGDVLKETPAQSLEAVKRECNQEFVGDALDELPWYHDREFLRIDDLIKFAGIDS